MTAKSRTMAGRCEMKSRLIDLKTTALEQGIAHLLTEEDYIQVAQVADRTAYLTGHYSVHTDRQILEQLVRVKRLLHQL